MRDDLTADILNQQTNMVSRMYVKFSHQMHVWSVTIECTVKMFGTSAVFNTQLPGLDLS